jgi:hypothetical protein
MLPRTRPSSKLCPDRQLRHPARLPEGLGATVFLKKRINRK